MITVTDHDHARVQQVVDEMARTIGLQPPRVRVCDTKACASVGKKPRRELTLHVDPKLARAPLSVLRKMLADELAHLWCRHPTRQRRTVGLIFAAAIAIWLAALIWTCALDHLRDLVLDLSLIALGSCAAVIAIPVWHARSRAYEREADRAAVDLFGIGVDEEVANWMQANGFCDDQTHGLLRTHPKLTERVRATATHQQQARRRKCQRFVDAAAPAIRRRRREARFSRRICEVTGSSRAAAHVCAARRSSVPRPLLGRPDAGRVRGRRASRASALLGPGSGECSYREPV